MAFRFEPLMGKPLVTDMKFYTMDMNLKRRAICKTYEPREILVARFTNKKISRIKFTSTI